MAVENEDRTWKARQQLAANRQERARQHELQSLRASLRNLRQAGKSRDEIMGSCAGRMKSLGGRMRR
jgi:hypothetical protein